MSQSAAKPLVIVRAAEHNLKSVTLDVPHDRLVGVTGLSGSGKSSLAFDTIYAEGQRRYIETFSPYTRQFFDKIKQPSVDLMENIRPAVAIQQRTRVMNSRSTVGSMTDVNEYLKIIWSNLATPFCPGCGIELKRWTSPELADYLPQFQKLRNDRPLLLGAQYKVINSKHFDSELDRLRTLGFSRLFNEEASTIVRLEDTDPKRLAKQERIILVLERLQAGKLTRTQLIESLNQAFEIGSGTLLLIEVPENKRRVLRVAEGTSEAGALLHSFSTSYGCPAGRAAVATPRPALFSANHPLGACPACKGFGRILSIDERKCVPDPNISIEDGALQCWASDRGQVEQRRLIKFCATSKIPVDRPWKELTTAQRDLIFNSKSREYRGVRPWFGLLERKAYKMHVRVFLARYRTQVLCPECGGARLQPQARAYQIQGKTLPEIWSMPLGELAVWLAEIRSIAEAEKKLARELEDVFSAVLGRIRYLVDLGLPYLSLDRQARTLSGGETQRVNLATALGSELVSTQFVLDEPSVGLHPRDTDRLNSALRDLADRGNSVLVVEHDLDCLENADHIVELGPKAGEEGGEVTFNGPRSQWQGISVAPPKLSAEKRDRHAPALSVKNASARNISDLSASIPLGQLVCLSGVSGSGKSTLVHEVLVLGWEAHLRKEATNVAGFEHISELVVVDQAPLSKTPRANIATYTGVWDRVRDLFAETEYAKARAFSKSTFSFNVDGGRCPTCSGAGFIREDMQFLSDVFVTCETCLGKRFMPHVLETRVRGQNVDELLSMTVQTAADFFATEPKIAPQLRVLTQLGLGHLRLGHALSELSGGESQRLKLVPYVTENSSAKALLVFDEPTTGLHIRDIERLLELFRTLIKQGQSVLCIEHNLLVLCASDYLIDLGPEGGKGGGQIVAEGPPAAFLTDEFATRSSTARYLQKFVQGLKKKSVSRVKSSQEASEQRLLPEAVEIRGARENNLKNISVTVPLRKVVALTGLSGSGKSSIAKDILYAEGQRRYLDCLSPYARQFINELKKPEIDSISHIQPTICVYQHTFQPSRTSTVGTMSEVYHYLRLLFAKVGVQHCPEHPEQAIAARSPKEIAEEISSLKVPHVKLLAPIVKLKKGHHKPLLEQAISEGIAEVRADGLFGPPGKFIGQLTKTTAHTIEFVIGSCNPRTVPRDVLEDTILQALNLGSGTMTVIGPSTDKIYSRERSCPICSRGFFKPDPEDFSFSSRRGRCLHCDGTGKDPKNPLEVCPECHGTRLGEIGRNVRINGRNIAEVVSMRPSETVKALSKVVLPAFSTALAKPIIAELTNRLEMFERFGLDYLALSRECSTLSGGELQRLRLAAAMGSPLTGVMYIFDEPSAGLHPKDNRGIVNEMHTLAERGNSVVVIEHDAETIAASDYLIEVGPGAGRNGGHIVAEGTPTQVAKDPKTLWHQWKGELPAAAAPVITPKKDKAKLTVDSRGLRTVKPFKLTLPLEALVSVAGVSGAGKSTLVHELLVKTIAEGKESDRRKFSLENTTVTSDKAIDRVLLVDQKPIGINSRSTPASYLGIWDEVRKIFASSVEAQARGYTHSFFSYNAGKGRCPTCKGMGEQRLEMSFLAEARITCEDCGGTRFTEQARSIRYKGSTISEVLSLSFEEAKAFFAHHRKIHRVVHAACELGLGYLSLGQSSTTLSGGEAQRIKLVSELSASQTDHTLYVLDEPTVGLHRADTAKLIAILRELAAKGNTVVVIEHDKDVLLASDFVVELGPGPGDQGGKILYAGAPSKIEKGETPWGEELRHKEAVAHN